MKGEYLKDIIDIDDIGQTEILNVIVAPCGAGKTKFALEKLASYWGRPEKALYLIDTTAGRDQLLKNSLCQCYDKEWRNDLTLPDMTTKNGKVRVMTYAYFGTLCKYFPHWYYDLEVLICDEIHKLFEMQLWDLNKKIKKEESIYYIAWNCIFDAFFFGRVYNVYALTATPDLLYRQFSEKPEDEDMWYPIASFDDFIFEVPMQGEPRHYEQARVTEYNNLQMLCNKLPKDKKGIIYIPRIKTMEKCAEALKKRGIKAVSIWSPQNQDWWMEKEQLAIRKHIIANETIPDDIDVLLINKSCETSININTHIDYMVIHSSDETTQTQALGRYRNDLEDLYVFNFEIDDKLIIPKEMIGVKLFREDITKFILEQNIRDDSGHLMKQPSFIEYAEWSGYSVERGKVKGGKRYMIILEKEQI